jgi:dipeptidyl aminopeptidase/acylaminoacyl peptidase
MSDVHLQRLLERAGDDGRARAELNAWPVLRAAFTQDGEAAGGLQRIASRARMHRPLRLVAATAAVALLAVVAATSPGAAVADWLRDHIVGKPGVKHSAPALTHVPGGGRMLVSASDGVWVVASDGSRRLLRGYSGATWSPRGLYVGAWRGRELFAIERGGQVHWSLARSRPITAADWSPDGFRIAYLAGRELRVVAGDGTGDSQLRARVAAVAPRWKPHAPHLLALAARPRVVDVVATDAHALVWRHSLRDAVTSLAWSADGRRLAVASRGRVTILDGASGRAQRRIAVPRGFEVADIAFAHRSQQLAMTLNSRDGRAQALAIDIRHSHAKPRALFAGAGRFADVRWSPDDRWVLLSWPAANQWLFLRSASVSGVSAVRDIARQFDPGVRKAKFPAVADWCCG